MSRIIRDGRIVEDIWRKLDDAEPVPSSCKVIVNWTRWRAERAALHGRGDIGVAIPSNLEVGELKDDLPALDLIEVSFGFIQPKPEGGRTFDGRAYSQARLLRERHGFKGEIRAAGDVLRDMMHYMRRCGVNAFVLKDGADLADALKAFGDFSDAYQTAADGLRPVYLRR